MVSVFFSISVVLMNIVNCNYFLVGGSRETSRSGGSRETSHSGGTRGTSRSGGTSFKMKRPTLLRQLQTILVKYPDDSQILRVSTVTPV